MLIRCPQCQYANHVEADATKPRIVCARCATVISVEFLSNQSVPPIADTSGAGQTPSEPLFMKTPESPLDLDSLLNTPVETAPDQNVQIPLQAPAPVLGSPVVQTPSQVMENRWDNEEILEIPRASTLSEQTTENPLAIDDLFGLAPAQNEVLEPDVEYPISAGVEPGGEDLFKTTEATTLGAAAGSFASHETREDLLESPFLEETQNYSSPALETVPPADADSPTHPKPSVFAQDSYVRSASNTYVMATPDQNNKGRLAKVFLAAALCFALLGIGYFALSGLVKDWLGLRKQQIASASPVPAASGAPSSVAGTGASPAASGTNAKSASPSVAPTSSPVASASVKATATPTATATPATAPGSASTATNQAAATKATPTPPPAKTGTSGHSVGAADGSLAIQVASFKSAGEAQQAISRLKSAGVEARMVKADVPGMGIRFRVQAGRFTNETDASKYASELRAKGVARDFIVTGYQNQ